MCNDNYWENSVYGKLSSSTDTTIHHNSKKGPVHVSRTNNSLVHTETIFLEQSEPVLAPLGTHIELTCRVAMGYRIVWSVGIPGGGEVDAEGSGAISALSSRGIETEFSSAENREPTLTISGTVENNRTTVQCTAVNVSNFFQRCDGDVVTMTFYGKIILLL